MKPTGKNQEKISAVLMWLAIITGGATFYFTIYALLWLGYLLGFKM